MSVATPPAPTVTAGFPRPHLVCEHCGRSWSSRGRRRGGRYPRICTTCRQLDVDPRTLARTLRGYGFDARVLSTVHGPGCWVGTPFHERPVRIADLTDVYWLLEEIAAT